MDVPKLLEAFCKGLGLGLGACIGWLAQRVWVLLGRRV